MPKKDKEDNTRKKRQKKEKKNENIYTSKHIRIQENIKNSNKNLEK